MRMHHNLPAGDMFTYKSATAMKKKMICVFTIHVSLIQWEILVNDDLEEIRLREIETRTYIAEGLDRAPRLHRLPSFHNPQHVFLFLKKDKNMTMMQY